MRVPGFPGYRFEASEPDAPRLFAPDGRVAARFGPFWRELDVRKAALEHAERVGAAATPAGEAG